MMRVCRAVLVAVVDHSLQDARRDDARAPDDHGARPAQHLLVHVRVRFVGVDHADVVVVLFAVRLQVGEHLDPRVADGEVHVVAAVRDPQLRFARLSTALVVGCVEHEVTALPTSSHGAHDPVAHHLIPPDACGFASNRLVDLARLGRVVVGEDRLDQHGGRRRRILVGDRFA